MRCRAPYHYICLNMSNAYYKDNINDLSKSWICPLCSNITRRKGSNCNTPVRKQFETPHMDDSNMSCDEIAPSDDRSSLGLHVTHKESHSSGSASAVDIGSITLEQFSRLLDSKLDTKLESMRLSITKDIKREFNTQIEKLKAEFSATTDFLAEQQNDLRTDLNKANSTIKELQAEKGKLQSDLAQIKQKLTVLDKTSRSCNLEIHSVPEKKSENLLNLMKEMCEVLKIPIALTDIKAIRRVAKLNPSSSRPRNIIVTLPSERHRDEIISAVRRYNKENRKCPLNSSHIGVPGESCQLYVSEHLSFECKELHAATRQWAKTNGYKFVWVRYGRIYIRKNEESPAILVKETSALSRLAGNQN